jgi:long-chain acyl-CoA synthetase
VRFGRSASAPLPPEQHRAFERRFGISVVEAMGLTECASVAFTNPLDAAARKYGSPGRPLGVEARVVDRAGTPLPSGARGEIELRGPNVMRGYYKAPDATAAALRDGGWLATGDLGYRDADGFYFITGRLKELIIKGGENIAPREIDEALLAHPAVLEAAAVGVPDPDYGQEILACVVIKPGATCSEEELRAHCLRTLGRYKAPRYLRLVGQLPKGPSGKVQRLKLVDL